MGGLRQQMGDRPVAGGAVHGVPADRTGVRQLGRSGGSVVLDRATAIGGIPRSGSLALVQVRSRRSLAILRIGPGLSGGTICRTLCGVSVREVSMAYCPSCSAEIAPDGKRES